MAQHEVPLSVMYYDRPSFDQACIDVIAQAEHVGYDMTKDRDCNPVVLEIVFTKLTIAPKQYRGDQLSFTYEFEATIEDNI